MFTSYLFLVICQYLLLHCQAYPKFAGARDAHPQITAAPVISALHENELLHRQDTCTWPCAVCALYAPCETCVSLSTPAGMACCTSKLADQSACPTSNVPPDSTIYIYTLGSLTFYGQPTSLVIGSNTLTPGGPPATANGHTFSLPATATGGGVVEDGTTTALGTPISTVVGTGTGPPSTSCPVQQISDGQPQAVPCSTTDTGTQTTNTNTGANTNTNLNITTNTNVNTTTNTGTGTGTATVNVNTNTNTGTNTGTNTQTASVVNTNTNTGTGSNPGTNTQTAIGANTNTNTGIGAGTGAGTGTDIDTKTNTNAAGILSTYTIDGIPFTGNPTSLVAGTVILTPGGSSLTSSGHTIAILASATGGQIQVDGSSTILPIPITTNTPATSSVYTLDGIAFTGNPTSLVAGTVTLTPGGPSLTSSGHIIAIPSSATNGQIQVDGTTTSLPGLNTAIKTGTGTTGTNAGTITGTVTGTGTGTNAGTFTSTGVSRTSYIATNVPSGLPWGVMLTTVSSTSYTLTWVGSKINSPTTIIETGPSTTATTSQTAGGFIWTVPTLPPGFPGPPPGPPPGFPDPIGGAIDPIVPGCIFGCGPPGLGGSGDGGGSLPCLIDCGGGTADPDPSKPNPSENDPSNSKTTQSQPSSTNSASSCSTSTFPSCTQVVSVSSSTTITSTSCITMTGCSGTATTGVSTTSASSTGVYCSIGCAGCGPASKLKSKREPPLVLKGRLATPEDYWRDDLARHHGLASLPIDYMHDDSWKRGYIPQVSDSDFANNVNNFITEQIASSYPGAKPCPIDYTKAFSTALTVAFDAPPNEGSYLPSLVGLEGCTSVVIIGEKGCWISHFWEVPGFTGSAENTASGQTDFQTYIINPLENGGNDMPSPFAAGAQTSRIPELADGESGYKPEIRILTKADAAGNYVYDTEVGLIVQALTGSGRAFEGCTVTKTPYVPITQDPSTDTAKGKILIQYTNDQQNDMGEQLVCPQQAIYKVWFEQNMVSEHTWAPAGNQIAGGTGNKKRQNGACSAGQSGSTTATGTNTGSTNTNSNTQTNTNTNTKTNTATNTGTNSGFTTSTISSSTSVSSASNAAWSSAAAVPSAACWILADDGLGDSSFEVYGINGWAGSGGSKLWQQEDGCGILSGREFYTNGQSEFEGRLRDTQYAYFGLSFFKGGCVERAVHSAGGPAPGTGPGQIACQHVPSNLDSDQLDAVNRISGPQLKAVKAVADGSSTTSSLREDEVVQPGESSSASGGTNTDLVASASAALPHLSSAANAASSAPAPTGT